VVAPSPQASKVRRIAQSLSTFESVGMWGMQGCVCVCAHVHACVRACVCVCVCVLNHLENGLGEWYGACRSTTQKGSRAGVVMNPARQGLKEHSKGPDDVT
jgi:hypothetical protein